MKKSSLRPIALLFTFLFALTASATCIKHASMEINYNGVEIEVDPVGMWLKPETDYATFPKANIILVTHEHKDHFDRAAIHEIRTPATSIYVNQAVFGHFRNCLPTIPHLSTSSSTPRDVTTATSSPSTASASTSPAILRTSPRWQTSRTSTSPSCPVTSLTP